MPAFLPLTLGFLLFISLPASSAASADESDTVIRTKSGPIRGKRVSTESGTVTAYLGIPYAEPPVKKLRFQKPLPHQPWNHVLEATSFGKPCHQFLLNSSLGQVWGAGKPHSEDCLFLNIWVPYPHPSEPIPVLVWIHGGGYFVGAASLDLYNGAFLAATEKVIVASMNYRLGTLGFLFLPPDIPGNMGLWDQWLALKWVKENAHVFGGDPSRVTAIGHSAGAASVVFHLLSPASQSLLARAAVLSGTHISPWAWIGPKDANSFSLQVSEMFGCGKQNYSAMVSCLQDIPCDQQMFNLMAHVFKPTIDEDFLPDEPNRLLHAKLHQAKPLLAGITGDDGSIFVAFTFPNVIENDGILTWEQVLEEMGEIPGKTIALKYSENKQGPARYREALSHFYRDYLFACPMIEVAEKLAATGSPVYAYSFNQHISTTVWPDWMGAVHGMEVPYLFRTFTAMLGRNQSYTEEDALLSRRMMQYWAEFARNGNPTGLMTEDVQWPRYNTTEQNFFHISNQAPQIRQLSPVPKCDLLATHIDRARQAKISQGTTDVAKQEDRNGTRT